MGTNSPDAVYAIIAIGITISLAGKPSIKAVNITPSNPISLAKGSKKSVIYLSNETSETFIFASNHITIPAGKATTTALPSTYKVLSNIERTIVFPIFGALYGGNSNVNDDGWPLSTVLDKIFDDTKVIKIPSITVLSIIITPTIEENAPVLFPIKNIVIIEIIVGNLPLHGTNEFVNIAINLSRGESIILAPVTPQALQPNPIHIVKACFPHALHFLNTLSILKAIRGKYPTSSSSVNSGKKIAIGGSITATTQERTLYPPP